MMNQEDHVVVSYSTEEELLFIILYIHTAHLFNFPYMIAPSNNHKFPLNASTNKLDRQQASIVSLAYTIFQKARK